MIIKKVFRKKSIIKKCRIKKSFYKKSYTKKYFKKTVLKKITDPRASRMLDLHSLCTDTKKWYLCNNTNKFVSINKHCIFLIFV